jgi:hypothetical protein
MEKESSRKQYCNSSPPLRMESSCEDDDKTKVQATDIITLPCGCIYQDKEWLLVRIHECDYHKRKRTAKKPYRPKAECVRP